MAKIIQMPYVKERENFLHSFAEGTEDATAIMVAMKTKDGEVITGYWECDFGTRAELIGHEQADLIDSMILANLGERY